MASVRKKVKKKSVSTAKGKSSQAKKANRMKPSKVFIYALALAALGGGGYLAYDRIRKKKAGNMSTPDSSSDTIIINNSLPATFNTNTASTGASRLLSSSSSDDNFPLKRGSKGEKVRLLQQALAKTSPLIQVDGQFGPKTATALRAAGYPEKVDQALFDKIVGAGQSNVQVVFNPAALAVSLYKAAQVKSLDGVLAVLKQIKSVTDYTSVNEYYKKQSFISKTIVNDLLNFAFSNDKAAKAQIKNEFLRIGLKVDSSGTWSLQGIRLFKDLITIRETVVTDSKNNKIPVRRNTILGDEIEVASGMTWFKSIDNSILKVPTQDVKYT